MEYFKFLFENQYDHDQVKKLREEMTKLKVPDPSGLNKRGGAVDIDKFLMKIIYLYQAKIEETQTYVKNAFNAADLDGSLKVSLRELLILFKNLEPKFYKEDQLFRLFKKGADDDEDGMEAMSFHRFSELCFSKNFFSLEKQYEFIGLEGEQEGEEGLILKFDGLTKRWKKRKNEVKKFLKKCEDFVDFKYWMNVVE